MDCDGCIKCQIKKGLYDGFVEVFCTGYDGGLVDFEDPAGVAVLDVGIDIS